MGVNVTLEAIIVRKRNLLLPVLKDYYSYWTNGTNGLIFGVRNGEKWNINTDILIEKISADAKGYNLYGTDIPVKFVYPSRNCYVEPDMSKCIGIKCKKWQVSKSVQSWSPNEEFNYHGKYITDKEVIKWLENESNINTMKFVRDWVVNYVNECDKALERQKQIEMEYDEYCKELAMEHEDECQKLLEQKDYLIKKYQ